ncbi:MAG: NAD-binding protein, partial [Paracoccaceae bacterium]|nr:NAD-binding protein [Paracoccaceae bacterium]
LQMKLAVNTCLAGLMFGLVEGTNLARQCDLDMQVFRQVLEAGQLSSPVVKMKLPKLIDEDFSAQASVYQTGQNIAMILAAAKEVSAAMPIVEGVQAIQQRTTDLGFADKDVVATIKAYQQLNKI